MAETKQIKQTQLTPLKALQDIYNSTRFLHIEADAHDHLKNCFNLLHQLIINEENDNFDQSLVEKQMKKISKNGKQRI